MTQSTPEEIGSGIAALSIIGVMLAGVVGWVMNIITIWHTVDDPLTAKFILRVVGVFVVPIGAILGWL